MLATPAPSFPLLVNPDKSGGSAMLENAAELEPNRPNFPSFVSNFQPALSAHHGPSVNFKPFKITIRGGAVAGKPLAG